MDRRKRNITALGALITLATVVFVWGFYYLLGNPFLTGGMDLVVRVEDGAGVKRGDRVFLSGVDIGTVQSVDLTMDGGVVIDIRVRSDLALPTDTRARVTGDVFGAHTVQLVPGTAMLRLEEKDTIRGAAQPQLTDLAANLGRQATSILDAADSLLSPDAVTDLRTTTSILPSTALELRAALSELRLAASALRATAEGLAEARTGQAVTAAVNDVERSAEALTSAVAGLEASLNRSLGSLESVLAKVDSGEGTLGRLVNDPSLFVEFNNTLREMRMLASDIRERPGRYINLRIF